MLRLVFSYPFSDSSTCVCLWFRNSGAHLFFARELLWPAFSDLLSSSFVRVGLWFHEPTLIKLFAHKPLRSALSSSFSAFFAMRAFAFAIRCQFGERAVPTSLFWSFFWLFHMHLPLVCNLICKLNIRDIDAQIWDGVLTLIFYYFII